MSAEGDIRDKLEEIADREDEMTEEVQGLNLELVGAMWQDDLGRLDKDIQTDASWWGEKAIRGWKKLGYEPFDFDD